MSQPRERMADGTRRPNSSEVSAFIGARNFRRWERLLDFVNTNYPGVFTPEWLFASKKYGWGMRLKKSKSFCTFIPERKRFKLLIVFGRDERTRADAILPELASHVRDDYKRAKTYHDGRWVGIVVNSNEALKDVERLFRIKRTPKRR